MRDANLLFSQGCPEKIRIIIARDVSRDLGRVQGPRRPMQVDEGQNILVPSLPKSFSGLCRTSRILAWLGLARALIPHSGDTLSGIDRRHFVR